MKHIFGFLLCTFFYSAAIAQSEETLTPRILALDTGIIIAHQFNDQVSRIAENYQLAFIDEENKPNIRFVYKTGKNTATLRMDYKYTMQSANPDDPRSPKKKVVIYQRISGDLQVITAIYNYLFNTNITSSGIMSASTQGSDITYRGNTYQFIFLPDDYDPGYWVMTFLK